LKCTDTRPPPHHHLPVPCPPPPRRLLPIAYEFNPSLIIVSAGFDAAHGDPLGGCHVSPACYGHMTALLQPVAPLVLLLEGGYNLAATAASVEACVRVLCGEQPARMQQPLLPTRVGVAGIHAALNVQSR
jgi:histone deacetylase 6